MIPPDLSSDKTYIINHGTPYHPPDVMVCEVYNIVYEVFLPKKLILNPIKPRTTVASTSHVWLLSK